MFEDSEAARAERRARIEGMLARYPHVDEAGLAELSTYFDKEASALDIAMIASNEAVVERYRQFRAEHVDPITGRDWVRATVFALVVALIVLGIMWRAF